MTKPLRVKVEKGPSQGSKVKIGADVLVMGSDEQVDIYLPARGVSPRHAQIVFDGGQVMLEDLGSEEGTFRNGRRLLGPIQVFPGDKIGLGPEVTLILQGDDPDAAQETVEDEGLEFGSSTEDAGTS
jgi:two-component system, NtrC family, response regulator AtoC